MRLLVWVHRFSLAVVATVVHQFALAADQGVQQTPPEARPSSPAQATQQPVMNPVVDAFEAVKRGDFTSGLRLARPLADKGNVYAQFLLGSMYDQGLGVPQDSAEAINWWLRSADQGFSKPQHNIALAYKRGNGLPQSDRQAAKWFRNAADQGEAASQYELGAMYEKGEGIPRDYIEEYKWYNLAGSSAAERDRALKNRDRVAAMMSPQQVAEAQKLAREWKPKQ